MALSTALMVVKSNGLVEANYTLTVNEQRILLSCIAKISKDDIVTDDVFYTVDVKEIASSVGAPPNTLYRELKAAALRLKHRDVYIQCEPNSAQPLPKTRVGSWVQAIEYSDGDGTISIQYSKNILPYINQITSHFTQYKLSEAMKLKTQYGFRLFELLMQWNSVGKREFDIASFKSLLRIKEGEYTQLYNLKQRVLLPAIKDINSNSNLSVKWEQRKRGRTVTHLLFTWHQDKIESKIPSSKEYIQQHARPGESWEQAEARIKLKA